MLSFCDSGRTIKLTLPVPCLCHFYIAETFSMVARCPGEGLSCLAVYIQKSELLSMIFSTKYAKKAFYVFGTYTLQNKVEMSAYSFEEGTLPPPKRYLFETNPND